MKLKHYFFVDDDLTAFGEAVLVGIVLVVGICALVVIVM